MTPFERTCRLATGAKVLGLLCFVVPVPEAVSASFDAVGKPLIQEYCVQCHGPEKQKGDLRLDTLPPDFSDPLVTAKWKEVVNSLNSHEMPPEDEKQPGAEAAGRFASWIEGELSRSEIAKRSTEVILRRINRSEYRRTVRDLVGVDFDPAEGFPEDPPAGGFDNNGSALTLSPLQMELYYAAARRILDEALIEGERPETIKWRFEPEENQKGPNKLRVERGGQRILLNPGKNPPEGGYTVMRHILSKGDVTDFKVRDAGQYIIRFRAAARIPTRAEVVSSAEKILQARYDEKVAKEPDKEPAFRKQMERDMPHFMNFRSYDYGPPRARFDIYLGGQPCDSIELDVDAPESAPQVYEIRTALTTQNARVRFGNGYEIPLSLQNYWLQGREQFARPLLLLDWVEIEGPVHPVWPPESHRRIMGDDVSGEEEARARKILARFMPRAYRRPVTEAEIDAKLTLFKNNRDGAESFIEAMKTPLAAILSSPHFLFLVEPQVASGVPAKLTPFEFASRLSYFLWSSMPDDELFRLASNGELTKPAVLAAQVDRMLKDPKSEALVENFTGQWLGLRKVGSNPPAKNLYPEYGRHFEESIILETRTFFEEILRGDLDSRCLIKSDFVTINERLARFYGIPGVKGDHFRRVPAPPESHRGGLVTQASIHSLTSNGTRTSPVTRGVWVLKTLLGTDPGLPATNVGEIAATVPGIDKATVRQRLEIHRAQPACARCHDKIDPLGFAMENFDAAGEWREQEGFGHHSPIKPGVPLINATSKMPDGTEFEGIGGLQDVLLEKEDLFLTSLAGHFATYAAGREMGFSDRSEVRGFAQTMKRRGYTLRSLIQAIVASELFSNH